MEKFTYQINRELKFEHNQNFIAKATAAMPKLHHESVTAKQVVSLVPRENGTQPNLSTQLNKVFHKEESLIFDFGRHCVGHLQLPIEAVGSPMDAPLHLRLRFAERLEELAQDPKDYHGWLSSSWIQDERMFVDELPSRLNLPRRYSCRYLEITVLETSPKYGVRFGKPTMDAVSSAPAVENVKFESGDEQLDAINRVSTMTLHECMQEVFEDGPKRDRRLWLGDLRVQALADYASFQELALVRRCLYLFGAVPCTDGRIAACVHTSNHQCQPDDTFLFDYSLFFVSTLHDYYLQSQDQDTLADLFPIAKKQIDLALALVNDAGKLTLPESWPVFVDWGDTFNKDTCAQAILIFCLRQFIALARQIAMTDSQIAIYEAAQKRLIDYVNQHLYDPVEGLYVSGPKRERNIASQVWVVVSGVVQDRQARQLMKQTQLKLFPIKGIVTPYMYHYITSALFISGLKADGEKLLKTYWGGMIKQGADTFWEAFDPNQPDYSPYGNPIISSYCHAWSCTPVYLIKRYLLDKTVKAGGYHG